MEEIINAITLKTADYGESDKMLTLFSLEKGVVCVGAKGVKKDKARLKFTAEPFCFSELVYTEKCGRKTLKNATCRKSYFRISQNIKAYFCACVMSEFVTTFFTDNAEEELFERIIFALENFLEGKTYTTLIKFLLDSDCINFMVGAKLNQAHYNPALPIEIEIRKNIIRNLKRRN